MNIQLEIAAIVLSACLAFAFSIWIYLGDGAFWIDLFFWDTRDFIDRLKFRVKRWLVELLPEWVIEMATVRLLVYATTGKYGNTDVSELRAMTALRRWSKK